MFRQAGNRLRCSVSRLRVQDSLFLRTNPYYRPDVMRVFSSNNTESKSDSTTNQQQSDDKNAEDPTKEIVLTPGEKVVVASRLTMWAGIAVFASFCAYYIIRELLPT